MFYFWKGLNDLKGLGVFYFSKGLKKYQSLKFFERVLIISGTLAFYIQKGFEESQMPFVFFFNGFRNLRGSVGFIFKMVLKNRKGLSVLICENALKNSGTSYVLFLKKDLRGPGVFYFSKGLKECQDP